MVVGVVMWVWGKGDMWTSRRRRGVWGRWRCVRGGGGSGAGGGGGGGVVSVKIRNPAGAEQQGHLCCSVGGWAGPCRPALAAQIEGSAKGAGIIRARSPRSASGRSAAIPEAGAHLSALPRSDC